jgi:putative tricarboxylic transport membrane protein
MWEAFGAGLMHVLQWPTFGFLLLGVVVGLWLGAVPGIGGLVGLVIIMPFTYDMSPVAAFALMLSLFAVLSTGDTITSVLLGVPGSAAAAATVLDGYPMAKRGEAARALGAAYTCSMLGGIIGALFMAASLPFILPVILWFGSPEFFMLAVLGLAMCGSLSGASVLKGIGAAFIGLILAQVGYGVIQPVPRFHFGLGYLIDGIPLIPLVLGLFGLPELMELAAKQTSIARVPRVESMWSGIRHGIRDTLQNWWLLIRSSFIGIYIGIVPGLGASVVDWFAYGHAVQSAKDKSQFGKGDVRGVIAPEAANNSVRAGDLIPTVAFGIPSGATTALLLSAMLVHGLRPGTEMLTTKLDITFSFVWTIILSNIIGSVGLMFATFWVARLAFTPGNLLVPGVMLFIFMGCWVGSTDLGDWIALLLGGAFGVLFKGAGWPRPPLIMAVVLGPLMEKSFWLSMQGFGVGFLTRPATMVILTLVLITLYVSGRGILKSRMTGVSGQQVTMGEGYERNPLASVIVSTLGVGIFTFAAFYAQKWGYSVRLFPVVTAVPAAVLFAIVLLRDLKDLRTEVHAKGSFGAVAQACGEQMSIGSAALFLAWIAGAIAITFIAGQTAGILVYMASYLWWWGKAGWKTIALYVAGGWAILYVFYDRLLHIFWYPSLLSEWLS